jgi:hypothetical protein
VQHLVERFGAQAVSRVDVVIDLVGGRVPSADVAVEHMIVPHDQFSFG